MHALRTLGLSIVAAGLVAAAPAAAQMSSASTAPLSPAPAAPANLATEGGWNSQYAMLFSLQNVFTRSDILGDYGGGIGLQYNLGPTSALRFAVRASRDSNPPYETTNTYTAGGLTYTDKAYVVPAGPTSTFGAGLSGSYLVRLTTSAVAPYLGAGLSLRYDSSSRAYEDSINDPGTTTKVDNVDRTYALGLQGQLGLEWRVHRSISLFAEYGLGVDAFSSTSSKQFRSVTTATSTTIVESKGTQNKLFNFGTGLFQGGALGVVAFF